MAISEVAITPDTSVTENGAGTPGDNAAGGTLATDAAFTTATNDYAGVYGTFHFDQASGNWTYLLDDALPATQALTQGQTVHDFLVIQDGVNPDYTIDVTVTGTNDAAVIGGVSTGGVTEDDAATLTTGGALTISDVDAGEAVFAVQNGTAGSNNYGSFNLDAAGNWTYSADNSQAAIQQLGSGQTLTDSFTAVSADGTTQVVTVTITGTNDTAVIGGVSTGGVTEDAGATLTTGGALTISDVDAGQAVFAVQNGTAGSNNYGSFNLDAAGNWTYSADNSQAAIQQLGSGQTLTDSFTAVSADGTTQVVTVTITGTNDAAVIGGVSTGGVTEDAGATLTTGGALTISDVDAGQAVFAVQNGTAGSNNHGSFNLDAAGNWTYSADNSQAAIQQLGSGQTLTDSFTAVSADGTTQVVTVTITGTNDAAVIGGVSTGGVTEDDAATLTTGGALTISDVDAGQAVFAVQNGTAGSNNHGSFNLDAAGNWTYSADNSQAAIQQLPAGQTLTDSFTAVSADGTTQVVTVTITGTNDAATIGGTVAGTVREDNTLTATGTVTVTDADTGEAAVAPIVAGTTGDAGHGTFEVLANGQWTYTLNNADPAVQALPAGQTLTDTITVTSADGTDTQVITITIDGDNDPATITGTVTGGVTEDGTLTFTGAMNIADTDTGEGALVAVAAGTAGDNGHGTFEVLTNGTWTYTLNNADPAVQALPAGQTMTDTITVASVDGTDTQVVTVTITGANDVPTLGGDVVGAVTEDAAGTLTDSGIVSITDTDSGESVFQAQVNTAGTFGQFSVDAAGNWSYQADNSQAAIQRLSAGETATDSFTVLSADGSNSEVVTVTITGTNDNPVATVDSAATDDSTPVQINVLANDTDVDHLDTLTVLSANVSASFGTVTVAQDGLSITFTPGGVLGALGAGQTEVIAINYTVSDGHGGTANAVANVTVTGSNSAPVILPASEVLASLTELADGNVNENNFTHGVAGTIQFSDADTSDTHTASFAAQGSGYLGNFSLNPVVNDANGTLGWSFSVDDSALNHLAQGEVVRQYYTVTLSDGQGGTVDQVVEVDLVGTNDRAVVSSANVVVQQGEDPATASGQLTVTDEDGPAAFEPQASSAGLYGHFSVAADGSWSYVADQAYTNLAPNQYLTDIFTVQAADGTPTTVAVTIAGVDHPAVGHQDLFTTSENVAFGAGLNLFLDNGYGADVDPDGNLQISAVNGQVGAVGHQIQLASGALLTVNANGTFSYDPNHAFDTLTAATGAANQFGFDSFTYTLAGGSTTTAFVNIIGVNSATDMLTGNGHDNAVTGFEKNDTFMLNQGGSDSAEGLGGNDGFYFGGFFDSTDSVDGGIGNDTLALQGDTVASLGGVTNVEVIAALSGSDSRFGDTANHRYSYDLTSTDGTVGAGQTLTVAATGLLSGENMKFDGSAETDGNFRIFAGQGVDDLKGGAGSDGFFFGANGNLTGADHVDGGAGVDTLALRGNYVGGNAVVFQDGSFAHVEVLALLSGHSNEFSGQIVPTGFDYDVTVADGNVAAGQRLDVNGARLGADETMVFNGSAETDGSFRILGGAANDTLTGGAQSDTLYGGAGADHLNGGAGADVFTYRSAAESTSTGYDVITGFDYREDRLDLPGGGARAFSQAGAGNLSTASFDADLASGLDGVLGAGQAALFTATGGTLAGHVFAVVDANGVAGYQAGEDFVIELASPVVPIDPHAAVIG